MRHRFAKLRTLLPGFFLGIVFLFGCEAGTEKTKLSDDSFTFNPVFRGGSVPATAPKELPVPLNFRAVDEQGVGVKLYWNIPKVFVSTKLKVSYKIFRKNLSTAFESDTQTSDGIWDFRGLSGDEDLIIKTMPALDCEGDGSCEYLDKPGGPASLSYAIYAVWDPSSDAFGKSDFVSYEILSSQLLRELSFEKGFMDNAPQHFLGRFVLDSDREVGSDILNFKPSSIPWFLLTPDETESSASEWKKTAAPIKAGLNPSDGLKILFPDEGWERGVVLSRGDVADCDIYSDKYKPLCRQIMGRSDFAFAEFFGQKSARQYSPRASNTLPESRKFQSRAMGFVTGKSGTVWVVVADRTRLLFRKNSMKSCGLDPGEAGDSTYGAEGHCGFINSIGTFSPRMSCPWKTGGALANDESSPCVSADDDYSMSDAVAPSDFSLRRPGLPVSKDGNLYIPDAGNARVVRLYDFETAFASCGRLRKSTDTAANDYCRFDLLVGQASTTADPDDSSRFLQRDCVRGGERGGMSGAVSMAGLSFTDPTGGSGSGGAACQLDRYTAGGVTRPWRSADDFKDSSKSDISADTGLLSDRTRRMFRAPTEIGLDSSGKVYVLDMGFSMADSAGGGTRGILPPRIMVWNKDPFSWQSCTPTDPAAEIPSCSIDAEGTCSGIGCAKRQCSGSECNASIMIGQQNPLYGFVVKSKSGGGFDSLDDTKPSGYVPMTSFTVSSVGAISGVWMIGGRDSSVYQIKSLVQGTAPIVHNDPASSTGGVLDVYRDGIYCGLTVDDFGGYVYGWDCKYGIGLGYTGLP